MRALSGKIMDEKYQQNNSARQTRAASARIPMELQETSTKLVDENRQRMSEYAKLGSSPQYLAQIQQGLQRPIPQSIVSDQPRVFLTEHDRTYDWENCEDVTCCPPIDGPYTTSFEFRRVRLTEEMGYAMQMLAMFAGIALFIFGIIFYTLFRLGKEIRFYMSQKKKQLINKSKKVEDAGSTSQKMRNGSNDYEEFRRSEDTSKFAENKDDQKKFQDGIKKTISNYKDYNQKVKRFFETNDNRTPDMIDTRILDKSFDEWGAVKKA